MGTSRLLELTAAAGALTVTFVEALPKSMVFQECGGQLLSSGTSAEANESMLWIDRLRIAKLPDSMIADAERLRDMFDQIVAMTVESIKTTKRGI